MGAARWLNRFSSRLRELNLPLQVMLWDGSILGDATPLVRMRVNSARALPELVKPSMGGLARQYVEGLIDVEGDPRDIIALGESFAETVTVACPSPIRRLFSHSRRADRKAIQYHYDVGDDFYALWLDRQRVYSCAYFRTPEDSLETAQEQKLEYVCRKLRLEPGERFLDIGCGWGALAIWAAAHHGVHATGITLSENQYRHARQRVADLGLSDRVEIRLLDYRDVPEDQSFDKIASIGMFEHVGRKNLPVYFAKIFRLLKPGGLVLNHGITLNLPGGRELGSDIGQFVEDYVFPGGQLMHVSQVTEEMSRQGLEPWDVESLRPHYARTLWHWVDRLEVHREQAVQVAGEKRFRIWRIYMAGSAHAFSRGWMSIYQILGGRAHATGTLGLPLTRDYIYRPA